ncbi:helix-turn-helix transcriptional regulator [Psychrobacter sp. ANT_WB68]|uniref:helix-turn-helix transcriptional regulator n=1 Tax=Psychrobacter sp. ANT_WB68 TaxID=2597355 RepID=UPI0011F11008|nr:AraC family transcriptional regulator [Psychrobacter sp. ANT_WB68]KAA0915900.1 AraC family transcriptional regulator [Psychrobacter sp. ANT_WB68]
MNAGHDTDKTNGTAKSDSLMDIVGESSISNSAVPFPLLTPLPPISSTPPISTAQTLDAFDWKRTINDTYFDLNVSFRQPSQFSGYLQHAKLLDIGVSHYHANTVHYKRTLVSSNHYSDGINANNSDDSILITFPVTGSVRFAQENRQLISSPGQFFIELSNLPYEFYHLQEVSLYVIKVPLVLLTPQMGTIERQFARSLSIDEGAGRLLVFQIRQILELIQQHRLAALEVKILEQQLLNLIVLTLSAPKEVMMSNSSSIQSVHLKRIEHYVYLHLENPALTPALVAAACHISVRYLHKLFANLPYSFSEWVKELRLKQANHILKTKSYVTIDEVAHRVGYGDQGYFSRIYKQHFGYTPRDTPSTG